MTPTAKGDPLVWPGGLAFRLSLLASLVILTTLMLGSLLPGAGLRVDAADAPLDEVLDCVLDVVRAQGAETATTSDPAASLADTAADLSACGVFDIAGTFSATPTLLVGLVVGLAALLYLIHPTVVRLRERLRHTRGTVPAALRAWVDEEVAAAGLGGRVRVVWKLAEPRRYARVYGRRGSYRLLLSGGMLGLALRDGGRARSIVRHELAHIRNGDVDVYFSAEAIWWGYVLGAALPTLLLTPWIPRLGDLGPLFVADLALTYGVLLAIPFLARNVLLHEIEHRADLMAGAAPTSADEAGRWRALASLLRTHPSDASRRAVFDAPLRLLRVRPAEFFLSGIVVGLSPQLVVLGTGLILLLPAVGAIALFILLLLPAIIATAVFAAVLAYLIQRDVVAAQLLAEPPPAGTRLAMLAGLGIVGGIALSPLGDFVTFGFDFLPADVAAAFATVGTEARLLTLLPVAGIVVGTCGLCGGWIAAVAAAWTARILTAARPRRVVRRIVAVAALTLCLPLGYAYVLAVMVPLGLLAPGAAVTPGDLQTAMIVFMHPLMILALLAVAILPLSGGVALPRERATPLRATTGLLGPGATAAVADPRPCWWLLVGASVAFTACAWGLFLTPTGHHALVRAGVPPASVGTFVLLAAPALLAGWAVATTVLAPRLRWAHGHAVCLAGGVLLAGVAFPLATDMTTTFGVFERIFHVNYVGWGALLLSLPLTVVLTRLWPPRRAPQLAIVGVAPHGPAG